MPCRSSSSSARARRSTAAGNSLEVSDQRPCVEVVPAARRAREAAWPPVGDRRAVAAGGAQRRPGVVRDLARPDELPEGRQRGLGDPARRRRAGRAKTPPSARAHPQSLRGLALGRRRTRGAPSSGASARKYSATRSRPAPTQTTSPVAQSASSQAGWYPGTRRRSTSLSHSETGRAGPGAGRAPRAGVARRSIPCQAGRKRPKAACSAGSTSLRQRGERGSAQTPEHVRIAPFTLDAAGAKLTADEPVGALEIVQQAVDEKRIEVVACRRLGRRERAPRTGEPSSRTPSASGTATEERLGQAAGRHDPERVAEETRILGGDQALLAGDPHPERAPLRLEDRALRPVDLVVAQVTTAAQQIVQLVG